MAEFSLSERIELLVEGELSAEQRRELFTDLDNVPTRWREVAFAFMEQEKLRGAVRAVIAEERPAREQSKGEPSALPDRKPAQTTLSNAVTHRDEKLSAGRIAVLAAVFLAVFSLGLATGRRNSNTFSEAAVLSPPEASTDVTPVVAPRIRDERGIVGYVDWESRIGVRRLPVFDGTASEKWLAENPPRIDARLERLLARSGWRVTPARRLVSMQFDSGDTFTIPIDDLTYQYVGQQVF